MDHDCRLGWLPVVSMLGHGDGILMQRAKATWRRSRRDWCYRGAQDDQQGPDHRGWSASHLAAALR